MENKTPPPVETIAGDGVSIHLSYIRRDIDEMKQTSLKSYENINSKLDELKNGYVTVNEFTEHLKADEDHEQRIRVIETFMNTLIGKMVVSGSVGGVVVGLIFVIINHYWK